MQRPIKFRAWDKKRGRFHHGCSNVCLTLSGRLMWQFGYQSPDLLDKDENEQFVLQQYTGLKDKNGVEIYEGDIISDRFYQGVVEFHEGIGAFSWPHGEDWGMIEPTKVEVIGNIYENPVGVNDE